MNVFMRKHLLITLIFLNQKCNQNQNGVMGHVGIKPVGISALNYLKEYGVVVLSFPPQCNHKLLPLNRSAYDPLKKYMNSAWDSWHRNNPEKTRKICDIPGIIATVLPLATTESNITAGFATTGISPLNPDIFPDSKFLPNYVTDRPQAISNICQSDSSVMNSIFSNLMPSDLDEISEKEHERRHSTIAGFIILRSRSFDPTYCFTVGRTMAITKDWHKTRYKKRGKEGYFDSYPHEGFTSSRNRSR
ncbi:hypothetical protein HNY73_003436 [Argiope bruennichi]|uniref:Uncharacterized protein n=1 Tax=Argiope bruennichi TaxID=94029 RepID=A0A8T0FQL0_ARGBR|nr:hypothetical protein HNY73_003436 [Argiope bruennichi]